jgi:hypothetical protein
LVLAGLALEVVAFLVVDFVVGAFLLAVFPVDAALPVAALEVDFAVEFAVLRVELVEGLGALLREPVVAVGLAAARLVALADTVVRDPLAATTCLRPAESAADTATQTPASLSRRSSFLAWGAGMSAFSQTSRTSSALT